MSSSRSRDGRSGSGIDRRAVVRALLTGAAAAPVLAACGSSGFRPLYGSSELGGGNLDAKFAQLDIAPMPGRVGQRIRNELLFQTNGGTAPAAPQYRLEVALKEAVTATLVRSDGDAIGSVYNIDAAFRLIRVADKSVVLQGTSYGRAGFERFSSAFANVRAREEAENRAASTVGQELKTRLAAYLSTAA
jgi:LPS-assembly lipoprotein